MSAEDAETIKDTTDTDNIKVSSMNELLAVFLVKSAEVKDPVKLSESFYEWFTLKGLKESAAKCTYSMCRLFEQKFGDGIVSLDFVKLPAIVEKKKATKKS